MGHKIVNNTMLEYDKQQMSLTRDQKEAVGLLSIGTFLEFFDFSLYIHMSAFLNELFFPNADSHTTALLLATTFCSSYVLRPVGALLFGYIGDNIGRKATFVITTVMDGFILLNYG
ncbi:MAG: MFS transporter [Rickettsia conorii subsp. raoultii]|uniref:MFS transporter n=2 Tax=Rickettsia conorii TaxID=781 RepID=A0ABY4U1S9_RICCR|nr:MFS transporter [Rickettsia conorii]URW77787.1 MFS transporter [Rickettsia conorii subsp. raoultii]